MLNKFDRNYVLTIVPPSGESFIIKRPFTLEFDIARNSLSSANYAQLRLYNLSPHHRNLIRHDPQSTGLFDVLQVTLQAGYGPGPQYPVIFSGNAMTAYSHREGVNFITTIEAYDGGTAYQNATSNWTFPSNTAMQSIVESILSDLEPYGIKTGPIAPLGGFVSKAVSFSGPTRFVLDEVTNGNWFIDNQVSYVLPPGYSLGATPFVTINAQSGLLSTPYTLQSLLKFDILFEPRLVVGSTIDLVSSGADQGINGIKRVMGINHRGTISDAVCGEAVTTLTALGGVFTGLAVSART